jgi:hypothetical protein
MEASAFLDLCQHSFPNIHCLGIVKGVSDFGDKHKGERQKNPEAEQEHNDTTPHAVENADAKPKVPEPTVKVRALRKTALALKAWIVHSIPSITWEPDYSTYCGKQVYES